MILFVAPNPHKEPNREGFLQRVAAIDNILADGTSKYYWDIEGTASQADALAEADVIYVHSIYSAKRILVTYPILADKIITDLHGVVPEEERFSGNEENFEIMSQVEEEVFRHGKNFVAVSEEMVKHFQRKYPKAKSAKWIVLPIFETTAINRKNSILDRKNVVYAGGVQKWQNVDMMINAVNNAKGDYTYTFLTHSPGAFKGINEAKRARTVIKSVESSQVNEYYKEATFGFILRDNQVINTVSCPTKLIEYLSNDVVPIVNHPAIGDVKRLGYRYISIGDFISGSVSDRTIEAAIKKNRAVLLKLKDQTQAGKHELRSSVKNQVKNHKLKVSSDAIKVYLELNARYENKVHELWAANDQLNRLLHKVEVQEKIINDHKRRLWFIRRNYFYRVARKLGVIKGI